MLARWARIRGWNPHWVSLILIILPLMCFVLAGTFGRRVLTRKVVSRMMLNREDIAAIHEGNGLPVETLERLTQWVRTDARFQDDIEQLMRLADAAKLPTDDAHRLTGVMVIGTQLQSLLETEQDWSHPADILDPEGEVGLECEALLHLAESQVTHDGRINAILERLRDAAEVDRQNREAVERFVAALEKRSPVTARAMVREVQQVMRDFAERSK